MSKPNLHMGAPHTEEEGKQGQNGALSLPFILSAARRWWHWCIPTASVLAVVGAAIVYITFVPVYKAAAWVKIYEERPMGLWDVEINNQRFVENQKATIRSPQILTEASGERGVPTVPELVIERDIVAALRQQLKITSVGGSDIFEISFASRDAEGAANVVNAVAKTYYRHQTNAERELMKSVITGLEVELDKRAKDVSALRERVLTLSREVGAGQDSDASVPAPISYLQNQIADATVEQTLLEVDLRLLQEAGDKELYVPESEIERQIQADPELQSLRNSIEETQRVVSVYENTFQGIKDNRKYQQYKLALERDEAKLNQLQTDLRDVYKKQIKESFEREREQRIETLENQIARNTKKIATLQEKYDNEREQVTSMSGGLAKLDSLKSELEQARMVYRTVFDRLTKLSTEIDLAPDRVELFQLATTPVIPVELIPLKKMLAAGAGLFCLPFALAIAWEFLLRRISHRDDLEKQAKVPVIAEVCRLPSSNGFRQPAKAQVRMFEESVDNLRTMLVLSEGMENVHMLAVTSACSREGKTSIASQLAVSVAKASGERVLLIDGDMRAPDLQDVFSLEMEPGLVSVLEGEEKLSDAVQPSGHAKLDVLVSGRLRCSPHRLLGSKVFTDLLKQAREEYRYVIVDTPPVLAASEALMMARHCDASLICAMRDVTRVGQIDTTFQRLKNAGAKPIGAVLSGVPHQQYSHHYGSYGYELTELQATAHFEDPIDADS